MFKLLIFTQMLLAGLTLSTVFMFVSNPTGEYIVAFGMCVFSLVITDIFISEVVDDHAD